MSGGRMTHSYATMAISERSYDEIAAKLEAAGYDHAIIVQAAGGVALDMDGIALVKEDKSELLKGLE